MPTREIEKARWNDELNRFTVRHEGWLATLELIGSDVGAQVEARNLPLDSIAADVKDNEHIISITFGALPGDRVTHSITNPLHVWLKTSPNGAEEALEVESTDGMKTLLSFHWATQAEIIDDMYLG